MKLEIAEGNERKSEETHEFGKPLKSVMIKIGRNGQLHGQTLGSDNNNDQYGLSRKKLWRRWFKFWPL